ncbi:uncharacterized protein NEMAJ01_1189 [Nematocida major]|uniref:uncharacterized protein n=1 Tax=Nematocida major TaxID=1912982 RepID=UPI0020078FD4|nr:uncharacterized protein NEMAJ01_1189 [Nematocida major]KAH9386293.1 hypothetical protein NEMAJ01_1189 [Nematocida major]
MPIYTRETKNPTVHAVFLLACNLMQMQASSNVHCSGSDLDKACDREVYEIMFFGQEIDSLVEYSYFLDIDADLSLPVISDADLRELGICQDPWETQYVGDLEFVQPDVQSEIETQPNKGVAPENPDMQHFQKAKCEECCPLESMPIQNDQAEGAPTDKSLSGPVKNE